MFGGVVNQTWNIPEALNIGCLLLGDVQERVLGLVPLIGLEPTISVDHTVLLGEARAMNHLEVVPNLDALC